MENDKYNFNHLKCLITVCTLRLDIFIREINYWHFYSSPILKATRISILACFLRVQTRYIINVRFFFLKLNVLDFCVLSRDHRSTCTPITYVTRHPLPYTFHAKFVVIISINKFFPCILCIVPIKVKIFIIFLKITHKSWNSRVAVLSPFTTNNSDKLIT